MFNAQALRALGIDPAEVRNRGYPIKNLDEVSVKPGRLKAGIQQHAIERPVGPSAMPHHVKLTTLSQVLATSPSGLPKVFFAGRQQGIGLR